MKDTIAYAAIACALLCLLVYGVLTLSPVYIAWKKYKKAGFSHPSEATEGSRNPSLRFEPTTVQDILKAFAAVVDSLTKAGPALYSMIGSMLFLLIAAFAAGVF